MDYFLGPLNIGALWLRPSQPLSLIRPCVLRWQCSDTNRNTKRWCTAETDSKLSLTFRTLALRQREILLVLV